MTNQNKEVELFPIADVSKVAEIKNANYYFDSYWKYRANTNRSLEKNVAALYKASRDLVQAHEMGDARAFGSLKSDLSSFYAYDFRAKVDAEFVARLQEIMPGDALFQSAQLSLYIFYYTNKYKKVYTNYSERFDEIFKSLNHLVYVEDELSPALKLFAQKFGVKLPVNRQAIKAKSWKILLNELLGHEPLGKDVFKLNVAYSFRLLSTQEISDIVKQAYPDNPKMLKQYLDEYHQFVKSNTTVVHSLSKTERNEFVIKITADNIKNAKNGLLAVLDPNNLSEIARFEWVDNRLSVRAYGVNVRIEIEGELDCPECIICNPSAKVVLNANFKSQDSFYLASDTSSLIYNGHIASRESTKLESRGDIVLGRDTKVMAHNDIDIKANQLSVAGKIQSQSSIRIELAQDFSALDSASLCAKDDILLRSNSGRNISAEMHAGHHLDIHAKDSLYLKSSSKLFGGDLVSVKAKSMMSADVSTLKSNKKIQMSIKDKLFLSEGVQYDASSIKIKANIIENSSKHLVADTMVIECDDVMKHYAVANLTARESLRIQGGSFWNAGKLKCGKKLDAKLNKLFVHGVASTQVSELSESVKQSTIEADNVNIIAGVYVGALGSTYARNRSICALAEVGADFSATKFNRKSRLLALECSVDVPNVSLIYKDLCHYAHSFQKGNYQSILESACSWGTASTVVSVARWVVRILCPGVGKIADTAWSALMLVMSLPNLYAQCLALYEKSQSGEIIQAYDLYNLISIASGVGMQIDSLAGQVISEISTGVQADAQVSNFTNDIPSLALSLASMYLPSTTDDSIVGVSALGLSSNASILRRNMVSYEFFHSFLALNLTQTFQNSNQVDGLTLANNVSNIGNNLQRSGHELVNNDYTNVVNQTDSSTIKANNVRWQASNLQENAIIEAQNFHASVANTFVHNGQLSVEHDASLSAHLLETGVNSKIAAQSTSMVGNTVHHQGEVHSNQWSVKAAEQAELSNTSHNIAQHVLITGQTIVQDSTITDGHDHAKKPETATPVSSSESEHVAEEADKPKSTITLVATDKETIGKDSHMASATIVNRANDILDQGETQGETLYEKAEDELITEQSAKHEANTAIYEANHAQLSAESHAKSVILKIDHGLDVEKLLREQQAGTSNIKVSETLSIQVADLIKLVEDMSLQVGVCLTGTAVELDGKLNSAKSILAEATEGDVVVNKELHADNKIALIADKGKVQVVGSQVESKENYLSGKSGVEVESKATCEDVTRTIKIFGRDVTLHQLKQSFSKVSLVATAGDNTVLSSDGQIDFEGADATASKNNTLIAKQDLNVTNVKMQVLGHLVDMLGEGLSHISGLNSEFTSQEGNATFRAAKIADQNHTGVHALKGNTNFLSVAQEKPGEYGSVKSCESTVIQSGGGEGYNGVGCEVAAAAEVLGSASQIQSIGNNVIVGDAGVTFKAEAFQYVSGKTKKHYGLFGSKYKETETISTQVQGSSVTSSNGTNQLASAKGGIALTATDLFSRLGTDASAKTTVSLMDYISRTETHEKHSNLFGANHGRTDTINESSMQTVVANFDPGKTRIHAGETIYSRGTVFYMPGEAEFKAKIITIEISVLNNEIKQSESGLSLSAFGQTLGGNGHGHAPLLTPDPTLSNMQTLVKSGSPVEAGINGVNTAAEAVNTVSTLATAASTGNLISTLASREGLDKFAEPRLTATYTQTKSTTCQQTVATGGLTTDKLTLDAQEKIKIGGVPLEVSGDCSVKTENFIVESTELCSTHRAETKSASVSATPDGKCDVGGSVSRDHEQSTSHLTQQTHIGGTLTVNVKVWYQNGQLSANALAGHAEQLTVASSLDSSSSSATAVSANTNGSLSYQHDSTKCSSVHERAGVAIRQGLNDAFTADSVETDSADILDKEHLNTGKLVEHTLNESTKATHHGASVNLKEIESCVDNLNKPEAESELDKVKHILGVGSNEALKNKIDTAEECASAIYHPDKNDDVLSKEGFVKGDMYRDEETGSVVAVYHNEKTHEAYIAFQGSEAASSFTKDDKDILVKGVPASVKNPKLQAYMKNQVAQYRGYDIYLTGHSRGASQAEVFSSEFGLPAITFDNPGLDKSLGYDCSKVVSLQSIPDVVNSIPEVKDAPYAYGKVMPLPSTVQDDIINAASATFASVAPVSLFFTLPLATYNAHSLDKIQERVAQMEAGMRA